MCERLRTPVAIVGGGPVALMLALFLDHHGIPSTVFGTGRPRRGEPRGTTHDARTMEHYRRLGVSGPIRRLGLPGGHPTDIAYFTRYNSPELSRLPQPTPTQRLRQVAIASRTDQLPEPVHRADQTSVGHLLREHAGTRPNITLHEGPRITGLDQDAGQVRVRTGYPGRPDEQWTARYAVVSDKGPDFVQQQLGIRYGIPAAEAPGRPGTAPRATTAHLRLPTFHREVLFGRPAGSYWAMNADLVANLIALNGEDEFSLLTSSVDPDTADAARLTDLVRRAAGTDLPVEVLSHTAWAPGAALVAERFVKGRVLLAGNSAHPTPDSGFGLNTGVDDAANLAWKLAAVLQGWGGPDLLATYGSERRPIALRNTAAARELHTAMAGIERPAALDTDTPEGVEVRDRVGGQLRCHGERTDSIGVQLGVRYDGSPIIAPDADAEIPGDPWGLYLPTSVPGGRTPHLWLDDWHGQGSSLFDRFTPGYTLLRLGPEPPSGKPLLAAAQAHGMPLQILDVEDRPARDLYERDLVLVRPDQHVAWRGNQLPTDPGDLVERVTGAGRPLTAERI
ncbi:FAD-dependent monooxygenase [Streptomyces sp. H39-S7]|uniref:FAD-dependent monooxygenase n=1 Tax=Streptomyces sp. H39-S7 TaxID=3004357 RepID=UPI0022AEB163|nr:FAD-dependent monooxygenase [Streptomyces sp. H39-S7]MCZ4123467.1 FAD-dependent monooxygenase [Streptomyces sp. H39-S7]